MVLKLIDPVTLKFMHVNSYKLIFINKTPIAKTHKNE